MTPPAVSRTTPEIVDVALPWSSASAGCADAYADTQNRASATIKTRAMPCLMQSSRQNDERPTLLKLWRRLQSTPLIERRQRQKRAIADGSEGGETESRRLIPPGP